MNPVLQAELRRLRKDTGALAIPTLSDWSTLTPWSLTGFGVAAGALLGTMLMGTKGGVMGGAIGGLGTVAALSATRVMQ